MNIFADRLATVREAWILVATPVLLQIVSVIKNEDIDCLEYVSE